MHRSASQLQDCPPTKAGSRSDGSEKLPALRARVSLLQAVTTTSSSCLPRSRTNCSRKRFIGIRKRLISVMVCRLSGSSLLRPPLVPSGWHNVRLFRRDGMPIDIAGPCGGVIGDGNHKEFAVSLQYFPSRIERYDVLAFSLSLVVVDTA